jgi:hypothetical protein
VAALSLGVSGVPFLPFFTTGSVVTVAAITVAGALVAVGTTEAAGVKHAIARPSMAIAADNLNNLLISFSFANPFR